LQSHFECDKLVCIGVFLLIHQGTIMFKVSRILLIAGLLAAQSSPVNAGAPGDYSGFGKLAVVGGLGCIGVGCIAGVALYKSFQWAWNGQGPRKYVGRTILGTAGIAAVFGAGYGISKLNK
jgi:hypothetical protein